MQSSLKLSRRSDVERFRIPPFSKGYPPNIKGGVYIFQSSGYIFLKKKNKIVNLQKIEDPRKYNSE